MDLNIKIDTNTYTFEEDDKIDAIGNYYFTKEYRLKQFVMDRNLLLIEDMYQNLKNAGFNTLYDVIENPDGALKAVGINKEEIKQFRITICVCLKCFGLLPLHSSPRFVFTKYAMNRIRNAIRKDKLEFVKEEDSYRDED